MLTLVERLEELSYMMDDEQMFACADAVYLARCEIERLTKLNHELVMDALDLRVALALKDAFDGS